MRAFPDRHVKITVMRLEQLLPVHEPDLRLLAFFIPFDDHICIRLLAHLANRVALALTDFIDIRLY